MRLFRKIEELADWHEPCAVVIGNFDGVHRGHTSLLNHMLDYSRQERLVPSVLTFFPHPVEVLNPSKKVERLTTLSEKLAFFDSSGVHVVLLQNFDEKFSRVEPEAFFQHFLKKGLKAKSVHIGFNFRFGRNRRGGTGLLEKLCQEHQIHFQVEPPYEKNGIKVSSSLIRKKILGGEMHLVSKYLGRPYAISGTVVRGNGKGKLLGFPTANVDPPLEKVVPLNGVYVSRAVLDGDTYPSVTNIGVRPTLGLDNSGTAVVEVHIPGFSRDIYGKALKIEFLERIRDEVKFGSLDALKIQINKDVRYAVEAEKKHSKSE